MIRQVLMGDGLGEVTLDRTCPRSLVEDIDLLSHIAITPSRIAAPTLTDVQAAARWYGRIVERPGSDNTIRAHSCSVWLGDTDDKGPYILSAFAGGDDVDGSSSAQAMMVDLFDPSTNVAGLTLGDYSSLSGSPVPITYENTRFSAYGIEGKDGNPRAFIERACEAFGWHWAVRGTTFDIGDTAGDIFRTDDVLIAEGLPLVDLSLRIVPGRVTVGRSDADFATRLIVWEEVVTGSGATIGSTAAAPSSFPKDAAGAATSTYTIAKWRKLPGFIEDTALGTAAAPQILADEFGADKRTIDVTVDADDPAGYIEPGDTVLVWKPEDGVYDLTNEVDTPLGCIYPLSVSVSEMSWPVGPGMGVYLVQNSDSSVVDLSDVYVPERGTTSLVVGERAKTLAEVVNGRN